MTCSHRLFCEEGRTSHFFHWRIFWLAPDCLGKMRHIKSLGFVESSVLPVSVCVYVVAWTWGFPCWRTQRCLMLSLCPLSAFLLTVFASIACMLRNIFCFTPLKMRIFFAAENTGHVMVFLLLYGMLLMLAQSAGLLCTVLLFCSKLDVCFQIRNSI